MAVFPPSHFSNSPAFITSGTLTPPWSGHRAIHHTDFPGLPYQGWFYLQWETAFTVSFVSVPARVSPVPVAAPCVSPPVPARVLAVPAGAVFVALPVPAPVSAAPVDAVYVALPVPAPVSAAPVDGVFVPAPVVALAAAASPG
jgi:hypothetical protein